MIAANASAHAQAVIDAFGQGAIFALIAVGIGLVFGVLRLVNFAYGQLIMIAAYMLAFTDSRNDALSILIAVGVTVFAALVMERVAFRPLRTTSPATMLVATFAISFLLQNAALLRYTYKSRPQGDSIGTLAEFNRALTIGPLHIRWVTFLAVGVTAGALIALLLLLEKTSLGLQLRAASSDFSTARLLGVRANTVIMSAVAISGVLAALAAVILSISRQQVDQTTGLNETIFVLVGVVVGGMDRLLSATLGGFAIGFANSIVGSELPTQGSWPFTSNVYLPSVIYLAVILVLLVRPGGVFARSGQAAVERV